jgi:hypothetical protein
MSILRDQSSVNDAKKIHPKLSALETSWIFFVAFNGNCPMQARHREPNLVQLELPGHSNPEYVYKEYFLACL